MNQTKPLNINLFGGPGTGKSLIASSLFVELKKLGKDVEYIQEFAKDLTYSKDFTKLSDQLLILGEQHHRQFRLRNQVQYIVHDSPFLMGIVYLKETEYFPYKEFISFSKALFNSKNNLNIFLERNISKEYQTSGRSQTLEEALEKDKEIKELLSSFRYNIVQIEDSLEETVKKILSLL